VVAGHLTRGVRPQRSQGVGTGPATGPVREEIIWPSSTRWPRLCRDRTISRGGYAAQRALALPLPNQHPPCGDPAQHIKLFQTRILSATFPKRTPLLTQLRLNRWAPGAPDFGIAVRTFRFGVRAVNFRLRAMSQMLKSSGADGRATLISRLLGMVREMVYANFMGTPGAARSNSRFSSRICSAAAGEAR